MLSMTTNAVQAVRQLAASSGLEPDPGLRIAPDDSHEAGPALQVSIAGSPEASDERLEAGGAHVYVDSAVAGYLDDKVLDASLVDDRVRFTLRDHEGQASGPAGPAR